MLKSLDLAGFLKFILMNEFILSLQSLNAIIKSGMSFQTFFIEGLDNIETIFVKNYYLFA